MFSPEVEGWPAGEFPAQLATLRDSPKPLRIKRGTRVFSPGEIADRLFFLHSGRVKISVSAVGGKQCVFRIVEPGQVFGECALFDEPVRKAEAEVIEKAAISVISRETAMAHAQKHPEFWASFSQDLGRRIRELEQQVQWLTLLEVEQRIAGLLLQWGKTHKLDAANFEIHLSQRDVAGLIGATRETTSAALNRLRRKGCVDIRRRCVVVKSVEMLQAYATPTRRGNPKTVTRRRIFVKTTS